MYRNKQPPKPTLDHRGEKLRASKHYPKKNCPQAEMVLCYDPAFGEYEYCLSCGSFFQ